MRKRAIRVGVKRRAATRAEFQPEEPPQFALRYGQVIWLLTELGFRGPVTEPTFREYIKSLRKLGLPWPHPHGEARRKSPWLASYRYGQVMELALALTLRVYNSIPDSVLREIICYRDDLGRLLEQAYLDRDTGIGAPIRVKGPEGAYEMRGAFLDLRLEFGGGALKAFGPPQLIGPEAALHAYATADDVSRAMLPIPVSRLAEQVVDLAGRAPPVRSGPARRRRPRPSEADDPRSGDRGLPPGP